MTECHELQFLKKKITLNYKGGNISSDTGLLLFKELDYRLKITDRITNCITDVRDPRYTTHKLKDLITQRFYSCLAGYEDCNDADSLQTEPILMTIANKLQETCGLASQPTLSRLENMVTAKDNQNLFDLLVELFIERYKGKSPETLIIDIDGTDDPAHGAQQMTLFNGYYGQNMYSPLIISAEGHFLDILLRKGNAHTTWGLIPRLKRVMLKIKDIFPDIKLIIRIDGGGASPEVYKFCEENNLYYVIGLIGNKVLINKAAELSKQAEKLFKETGEKQKLFDEFGYQAKSWDKSRMVTVKAEHNAIGPNKRFIVTNMDFLFPKDLYEKCYSQRGKFEQIFDELKNGLNGGRLSCHRFIANQFRLLMAAFQYETVQLFREYCLLETEYLTARVETIRRTFIKIGSRVKITARRVWVECCSSYPYKNLINIILNRIHKIPEFIIV
jgi:hypothetical protein